LALKVPRNDVSVVQKKEERIILVFSFLNPKNAHEFCVSSDAPTSPPTL
jgi:hypothetical protein